MRGSLRGQRQVRPPTDVHFQIEGGLEDAPHVTVKYGLIGNHRDAIEAALSAAVEITLQRPDVFASDESDVLVILVESEALRRLNANLSILPHVDTHAEYKPHITIGYLKPGRAEKYIAALSQLCGRAAILNRAEYSTAEGELHSFDLTGAHRMARAPKGGVSIKGVFYPGGRFIPGVSQAEVDRAHSESQRGSEDSPQPTLHQESGTIEYTPEPKSDSEAVGFASPNTSEGLSFDQALKNLGGEKHARIKKLCGEIDDSLGLKFESRSIIGDWGDGAEDSILTVYQSYADYEELRYAMAWKGLLADQKSVLLFEERGDGAQKLYQLDVDDTIEGVRERLSQNGINYRSIEIGDARPRVVIVDLDGTIGDAIGKIAEEYDVEVTETDGQGELIGVDSERSRFEASEGFRALIREYEEKFPDRKRYRPHEPFRLALEGNPGRAPHRPVMIAIGRQEAAHE